MNTDSGMLLGLGFKVGISKLPVGEYIYAKEIGKQEPQIKASSTPSTREVVY